MYTVQTLSLSTVAPITNKCDHIISSLPRSIQVVAYQQQVELVVLLLMRAEVVCTNTTRSLGLSLGPIVLHRINIHTLYSSHEKTHHSCRQLGYITRRERAVSSFPRTTNDNWVGQRNPDTEETTQRSSAYLAKHLVYRIVNSSCVYSQLCTLWVYIGVSEWNLSL